MFYVYVLLSDKDRKLYVGLTSDLRERIRKHKSGRVPSTVNRLPVRLIYYECYMMEFEAKRRELYLKGGNGREQLKIQISETLKKFGYRFR